MRSDPPLIAVHAGAQLTRSGDFHRFAMVNRARLASLGISVAYPSGGAARFGYAVPQWPVPGEAPSDLRSRADSIMAVLGPAVARADKAFVLSDAMLSGPEADLLQGRFCEGVGLRATALRMALGRRADRVVMTIRPYDALFRAIWRKTAAERAVAPFAAFASHMAGFSGGWIDVAEALRDVLEPDELVIETMPPEPHELLQTLVPELDTTGFEFPTPAPEVTASAAAMLQRQFRLNVAMAPGQRDRLIAFHARLPQDPMAEDGFDALTLADLRGRYVADLSILARMKGATLKGDAIPAMQMPMRYARAGA